MQMLEAIAKADASTAWCLGQCSVCAMIAASLDRDTFWRVHRSYLVNINRIKEVVPWFKSSYQLRMDDKRNTEIPVSRVQTKRLRELLKL